MWNLKYDTRDFPAGPVVKNPPSSAGNVGLIPNQGTEIPHAMGQPNQCVITREACMPQLEKAHMPPHATVKTQCSPKNIR